MAKAKPAPEAPKPPEIDPAAPSAGDPPADPPAADPAPPKGYVCLEPVKHNGKRHKIDDPIELTEAEAEPLLKLQAIVPA
jgi:hypothetical protein